MRNKVLLFVVFATFSHIAFAQNNQSETRPQAYLFTSSKKTIEPNPKRGYAVEQKPSGEISKAVNSINLERRVFDLINQQRVALGLSPLIWSDDVAKIARLHSENMAHFNFFSHQGLDGTTVNNRADQVGVKKWQAIGENIAYNQGFDDPVAFAVERWMKSPSHRENILNERWRESGIGVAVTTNGTYYFTEVFLKK